MTNTRNDPDTSAEAVERHLDMYHNHEADLIPAGSKKMIRTLAAERDALQTKLDEAVKKLESIEYDVTDGGCECSVCDIFRATLAKLKGETDE